MKKTKQGRYPSFMRAYPSAWHLQEIDNLCVLGIKSPDIVASSLSITVSLPAVIIWFWMLVPTPLSFPLYAFLTIQVK